MNGHKKPYRTAHKLNFIMHCIVKDKVLVSHVEMTRLRLVHKEKIEVEGFVFIDSVSKDQLEKEYIFIDNVINDLPTISNGERSFTKNVVDLMRRAITFKGGVLWEFTEYTMSLMKRAFAPQKSGRPKLIVEMNNFGTKNKLAL